MASRISPPGDTSSNSTLTKAPSSITPGLKWDNVNLTITLGRGKKAVKKQLLKVSKSGTGFKHRCILISTQGVSGYAHRGEMTAIMGPSGSGKTTLANVLTGRLGEGKYDLQGDVTFEGQTRDPSTWKSYV